MTSPVAITAMSGVFPGTGGPVTVEGFWKNIKLARPATLQTTEQKWGLRREDYFDPRPGTPYRTYLDSAYMISDRGASPQAEIGEQVIRDLFRSVGGTRLPDRTRVGLSVGTLWTDASYLAEDVDRVVGGGSGISTRVRGANILGPDRQLAALADAAEISGPALSVDTACASSLYALDSAIGLIEQQRADAVAVMGLNGFLPAFLFMGFSKLMALSPKRQILPFSSEASGIIPSEAVAAILIEPVEQAIRCGRQVLAVVRGLGLSADGGDTSIFAPNPQGQQLAYERAYRQIDPASVAYVEAHGTATVLGDATEIQSLDRFFAPYRRTRPLPIGSVKALVGHSIASAGISSLVKAICMIRDGVIPPHIDVQPNPKLRETCLRLSSAAEPWPEDGNPRRVAISSFGLGGANSHLIIGALEETDLAPARSESPRTQIAIVALDATMGKAHGAAAVREVFTPASAHRPAEAFPWQRFFSDPVSRNQRAVTGNYFPAQLQVEAQDLRMGPKALAKLDALQRLGIHAIQRTLASARTPTTVREDMAVVCCSNLGGEGGLRLSRHYLAHFSGTSSTDSRCAQVEPSMEAIASSLGSLFSGFVAFHLGIKGFHETFSGDSSTFWQALALAPHWLDSKCRSLVIAGARHIKSPIDLDQAVSPGEGVAAFLLQSEQEAARNGVRPLAVIRAIVPYPGGADEREGDAFRRACTEHGIDPSALGSAEISQLDQTKDLGAAQRAVGFLAEATGVEALLRVLLAEGTGFRAIEVRDDRTIVAHVLIEKLREFDPWREAPVMPMPIEFQGPPPPSAPEPAGPALPAFLAWQQSTETALSAYLQAQGKLLALDRAPATPAVPAAIDGPLNRLRRDEKNIVLMSPSIETDEAGTVASARLKVDESHSYFFDHRLDHVPGILILEGMLQLVELIMPEGHFIRALDLSFRRFCEKTDPAVIRARSSAGHAVMSYSVELLQNGSSVATCLVESAPAAARPAGIPLKMSNGHAIKPDPKYVHKLHPGNVLITEIEHVAPGQLCACDLLPPLPGHILGDGDPRHHSMLYVLETTRQFVMLIAHSLEDIPLGLPINLVSLRVRVDQPVPRDLPLRFHCSRQPVQRIGKMAIANITLELHTPQGRIGDSTIKAQVVDADTYSRQRGLAVPR
jgi:3-oxoacyl-(acyl-carrier-protein) synthase